MKTFLRLVFLTGLALVAAPYARAESGDNKIHLVETAPIVDDVEIMKGARFVEVYVKGRVSSDCFDVHDYQVNRQPDITRIVPHFGRSKPDSLCNPKIVKNFREKAADLDPANPASFKVEVLGYYGWHKRSLSSDAAAQK